MTTPMTKTRLLSGLLALTLALATAPAVMAQEEEAAFDPTSVAEFNENEALIIYGLLRDRLAAYGVAEEDMVAAIDWMDGEFLSPGKGAAPARTITVVPPHVTDRHDLAIVWVVRALNISPSRCCASGKHDFH